MKKNEVKKVLFSQKELAIALGVSPRTIEKLKAEKIISHIPISQKCVRYHLETVLAELTKRYGRSSITY